MKIALLRKLCEGAALPRISYLANATPTIFVNIYFVPLFLVGTAVLGVALVWFDCRAVFECPILEGGARVPLPIEPVPELPLPEVPLEARFTR